MRWPRKTFCVVAGIVGPPLVISACGGGSSAPKTFTIKGSVLGVEYNATKYLDNSSGQWSGQSCMADSTVVQEGIAVVVSDSKGVQVGLGRLGPGHLQSVPTAPMCEFKFTISAVPDTDLIYSVSISGEGSISYKRDELNKPLHLIATN